MDLCYTLSWIIVKEGEIKGESPYYQTAPYAEFIEEIILFLRDTGQVLRPNVPRNFGFRPRHFAYP